MCAFRKYANKIPEVQMYTGQRVIGEHFQSSSESESLIHPKMLMLAPKQLFLKLTLNLPDEYVVSISSDG